MLEEELEQSLRERIDKDLALLERAEPGSEERERLNKEVVSLTESLNKLNQTEMDTFDKQERRMADERNKQQLYELEVKKSKIDWKRWGLDMIKVLTPLLITWGFYTANQEKLLKYEEEGRVTSDTGRQGTRLPNPFTFFKK